MSAKTVLITGSSSGFGQLTAQLLAENGYHVFATMRGVNGKNENAAKELRDWASDKGVKLDVIELDVTDQASADAAAKSAVESGGSVDVVVNNAGGGTAGLMEAFTADDFKRLLDLNLFGAHRVNRAVLPHMRERKAGLLINISSTIGRTVIPFLGPYCPSKFALEAYSEGLNLELAPLGIESVIVEPGAYGTGFQENMQFPSDSARMESYGEMAKAPQQMFEGVGEMLSGEDAPDPADVAKAVQKIIETPAGKRPLRTVVDAFTSEIITKLNDDTARQQQALLKAFGM